MKVVIRSYYSPRQPFQDTGQVLQQGQKNRRVHNPRRIRIEVLPFQGRVKQKESAAMIANAAEIELTEEQREAIRKLTTLKSQIQTLGGYAGTGKSTVIKALLSRLKGFAVCAFTGKAANVLRRKGITARTVHSLIYTTYEVEEWDNELECKVKHLRFDLRKPNNLKYRGFIVDEASMIGRYLDKDLRSFGLPIIYVGDHGQLEPVADRGFNLMENPDITLEKVHRNAGSIAHFAEHLRKGYRAEDWEPSNSDVDGTEVSVTDLEEVQSNDVDQMICAFNSTRVEINKAVREVLGYPDDRPVVNDRIICLQNVQAHNLWNGMQGTIVRIDGKRITFRADNREITVAHVPEQFNNEKRLENLDRRSVVPFDYAYVVTCHKAQGDEWDKVLVLEQKCGAWSHSRWAYTAASRACKKLIWVPWV